MLILVLYVPSSAQKTKNFHNFFDPNPNKGVAMQVLVIDNDDSQKKSAH